MATDKENAMTTEQTDIYRRTLKFNRFLYGAFVVFCIYFLIRGDVADAASNLGIALIFDPFVPAKWEERKGWQKAWLFVHVSLVIGLFAAWFIWK